MPDEPTFDHTGGVAEWRVKAGDAIREVWTVTDGGSLTGATCTGAIRATNASDAALVETLTMTVLSSTSLRATASAIDDPGRYWWGWKVVLADTVTIYRGEGPFIVEDGVV